jgi:VanZ family protein
MLIIFSFSTDSLSTRHTSRIIGPLLRWFNPDVTEKTIQRVQTAIRKSAHVTEYAILSMLLWRSFSHRLKKNSHAWSWRLAGWVLLVVAAYAATDEFHQSFVPSRMASPWDVLIDTVGAALGLLVLWIFGRWRKWW